MGGWVWAGSMAGSCEDSAPSTALSRSRIQVLFTHSYIAPFFFHRRFVDRRFFLASTVSPFGIGFSEEASLS